eukprot:m.130295 g.130295  ORF g.130295 m.130295 type:complete len:407 (-) comp9781_c0_seq5:175-1395(-)
MLQVIAGTVIYGCSSALDRLAAAFACLNQVCASWIPALQAAWFVLGLPEASNQLGGQARARLEPCVSKCGCERAVEWRNRRNLLTRRSAVSTNRAGDALQGAPCRWRLVRVSAPYVAGRVLGRAGSSAGGADASSAGLASAFVRIAKAKTCRVRLAPDKIHLIALSDIVEGQPQVWAEVQQDAVFRSYRLESRHANNEIMFEVHTDHLLLALRSGIASTDMTLKLTKHDGMSYLAVLISSVSNATGATRPISHDLPIQVCSHEEIERTRPPILPVPDVNVYLPDPALLKNIVDKMRSMSNKLIVSANNSGELSLQIDSTMVTVTTSFNHLENPPVNLDDLGIERSSRDPTQFVRSRIDIKRLAQFFSGQQQHFSNVLMSISPDKAVTLILLDERSTITYYIPCEAP